jgi:hypothetical protein
MSWFLKKPWRTAAAALGAVLMAGATTPTAQAGFTKVQQAKRASGPSHEQILEHVYGGDFVADSSGLGFSSDTGVTVTRLDDAADGTWHGTMESARSVAAFGRNPRATGYFGGSAGGRFSKLIDTGGRKFDVSGVCDTATAVDGELSFGRGRKANRVYSSVAENNRDDADHLVSYEVHSAGADAGSSTYLLFWEDKLGRRSDRDFNDLVVEIRTASTASDAAATAAAISEPLLIPLPPALWSGLGGLVGLGAFGAVRRSRGRRW